MWQIIIMLFVLLVTVNCEASSGIEEYKLQEMCGKRAQELFNEKYTSNKWIGDNGQIWISNYENHYNTKLKKCFILITSTTSDRSKNKRFVDKLLYDVNENKEYGICSGFDTSPAWCKVKDTECHSEAEWDSLAKPYMVE